MNKIVISLLFATIAVQAVDKVNLDAICKGQSGKFTVVSKEKSQMVQAVCKKNMKHGNFAFLDETGYHYMTVKFTKDLPVKISCLPFEASKFHAASIEQCEEIQLKALEKSKKTEKK